MDFDLAAKRLQSDQENLRGRTRARNASRKLASTSASDKARRAELYRQKQREKKLAVEKLQRAKLHKAQHVMHDVEKRLVGGVEHHLTKKKNDKGKGDGIENAILALKAMSVHGEGDKITLPPSVLGTLAERDLLTRSGNGNGNGNGGQQPLFFRMGIRREGYVFPQSVAMKNIMEKVTDADVTRGSEKIQEDEENDYEDVEEEMQEQEEWNKAYLEELDEEYLSYTYGSVVEFSQEEGCIGLPRSVARALLRVRKDGTESGRGSMIPSHVTVDPANIGTTQNDVNDATTMEYEKDNHEQEYDDESSQQTPGHAAYGKFHVPTPQIDLSLLMGHLPLGKHCTLRPTRAAIQGGFYSLKNIKVALEQSLIGTRSCLNVRDIVSCWFRGKKYDLEVIALQPHTVGAVSCINCDIEVEIAPEEEKKGEGGEGEENVNVNGIVGNDDDRDTEEEKKSTSAPSSTGYRLSGGSAGTTRTGMASVDTSSSSQKENPSAAERMIRDLPPEPPASQTENVIDVQIRGFKGKVARRRFHDSNAIRCLFDLARNEGLDLSGNDDGNDDDDDNVGSFKLVTRFPRRVILEDDARSLRELGLGKQEMFLLEK